MVDNEEELATAREVPPVPRHTPSTAQDASAVSGVDLTLLLFTDIPLIERIPVPYWEQLDRANTLVYDRMSAECDQENGGE